MCGICGYVGTHRPEILTPMCDAITHRGPDDAGTWFDAEQAVGFGHRRLSIIDLSRAGHQPMRTPDGTITLSYNGEIYDFDKHRRELEQKGYRFRGTSDTEVLLNLYAEYGIDFLQKLNGIFALAIWNASKRELILARDHAGVKPLYYYRDGNALYFSSEIKSLLRVPDIPRKLNYDAIAPYLTFLWVPGEQTMLEGVRKIEPGSFLRYCDGEISTHTWFELDYHPDHSLGENHWIERVHDTFMRTTRRQMVSDVPLGAFLSGGLDSSSIVACMRESFPQRDISTYTVRMSEEDMRYDQHVDDYSYAKRVAEQLDVNLVQVQLRPDILDLLPKMVYHLDEPDADPAVFPSYLISKLAREDGTTVLLSGTGGDELFFGYRSHQAYAHYRKLGCVPRPLMAASLRGAEMLGRLTSRADSVLIRRLNKFRRGLCGNGLDRHLALVDWSSPQVRKDLIANPGNDPSAEILERYAKQFRGAGEINRHSHLLVQTFLAAHNFLYTDKSSMATSIEARVPFMDVELMRLCARIPERFKLKGSTTKYVLKRAMERYLPRDVIYRSKAGFMAPIRKWILEDIKPLINDLIGDRAVRSRGLFRPDAVQRILIENQQGVADHAYLIYALLNLEVWMRTFIDRPAEPVVMK